MASTASIGGLISGLQTDDIINKMLEFGKKPITLLQNQQATLTTKLTAWQDINTRLLALRMTAQAVAPSIAFNAKNVSLSTADGSFADQYLGASVSPAASAGTYVVTVNKLAQAQQIQSQGFADLDTATIGTGTITVGVGTAAKAITIDSTNNTLGGLRDAINRAGVGVTATTIDLGSLGAHEYHMVLSSGSTGEAGAITWTPTLSGGAAPTWTTTTNAQDAEIVIGSGATATTVKKSNNSVNDVLNGVYLNLKQADPSKQIKITIGADTEAVKGNIKNLVAQYNSVIDAITSQFSYSADTKQSGALMGDFTLQDMQQNLQSGMLGVVAGLPGGMSTLSQIGITTDTSDHLVLDETKFGSALSSNPEGVMKLFAENGQATDYSISYAGSGTSTKTTGTGGAYKIRIDRVAQQARVTAGVAQTQNLAADETLTINGTAISLTSGMTASQVVEEINKNTGKTGVIASRTQADGTGTGDYLSLKRSSYGAGYNITAISTLSNGGGTPVTNTTGLGYQTVSTTNAEGEARTGTGNAGADVAGAFGVTVNGITTWENATGYGQMLTGNSGNANTDGLKIQASTATTGEHGSITLTRGVGKALVDTLDFVTGTSGAVTTAEDSITKQITDLKTEIDDKNAWLTRYEDQLRAQFSDLEAKMGAMKNQGDYLASQFAAMSKDSSK